MNLQQRKIIRKKLEEYNYTDDYGFIWSIAGLPSPRYNKRGELACFSVQIERHLDEEEYETFNDFATLIVPVENNKIIISKAVIDDILFDLAKVYCALLWTHGV